MQNEVKMNYECMQAFIDKLQAKIYSYKEKGRAYNNTFLKKICEQISDCH